MRFVFINRPRLTLAAVWGLAVAMFPAQGAELNWIDQQRQQWRVPGVVVAVVSSSVAPRLLASGMCNVELKIPCTTNTPFQLASMTKFMTGVLSAMLASEGKVKLDEPVQRAWPAFRLSDARATEVTLRDLLSGRSGLGSVDWPTFWDQSLPRSVYLERLPFFPMSQPFRAKWGYSNANFVAAGAYLEQKTQQSWEALVQAKLLEPLEMKNSGFDLNGDTSRGYKRDALGKELPMPIVTSHAIGPAGSLVSSISDYAKFLQMILNDGQHEGRSVVPAAALRDATAITIGMGFDKRYAAGPAGYGFGVFVANFRGHTMLSHSGGYPGYSTYFALLPQLKLGVAVLVNRDQTEFAHALALAMLDRELGQAGESIMQKLMAEPDPPATVIDPQSRRNPTRPWPAYAGRYVNPAWGEFTISELSNGLQIQMGDFNVKLAHRTYDSFVFEAASDWEQIRIRFESDFDGRIDSFVMDDGSNPAPQRFLRRTDGSAPRKQR